MARLSCPSAPRKLRVTLQRGRPPRGTAASEAKLRERMCTMVAGTRRIPPARARQRVVWKRRASLADLVPTSVDVALRVAVF
jgi:hypothetical protein